MGLGAFNTNGGRFVSEEELTRLKEAMELLKECRDYVEAYRYRMVVHEGFESEAPTIDKFLARLDAVLKEEKDVK